MKIAIIGNSGSGKSTLACKLHKLLTIPLYHLDQYFWKPGWQEPDRNEFEKVHNRLCNQENWIIEGMAIRFLAYRIEKADIIIFINAPAYLCFYRVYKRAFAHFGNVYFSSAPGCSERGPDWKFLKFIGSFNRQRKPIIDELLQHYAPSKQIFVVKNNVEIDRLLNHFVTLHTK